MRFLLIDSVIELGPERGVAIKNVAAGEEYLADHFPTFPVLPGVFMVEALAQTARRVLAARSPDLSRHVLGSVRALKFGAMVRPGEALRVEVNLTGEGEGGVFEFRGTGVVVRAGETPSAAARPAVSGRFTMRPLRTGTEKALVA